MKRRHEGSRGYSLSELLTIVAIIGLISMVTIPAFMQLMPQYRLRSAASEMAASLKVLRARAVATRSNWRMEVDRDNNRYRLQRLNAAGTPQNVNDDGWAISDAGWKSNSNVDIMGSGSVTITFDRAGTVPGGNVFVVLGVNSQLVRFNRYTIGTDASGNVVVVPSKV